MTSLATEKNRRKEGRGGKRESGERRENVGEGRERTGKRKGREKGDNNRKRGGKRKESIIVNQCSPKLPINFHSEKAGLSTNIS